MKDVISNLAGVLEVISPTPRSRALLFFVLGQHHEYLCTNYLNLVVRFHTPEKRYINPAGLY